MRFRDIFIVTRAWSLNITFVSVTLGTLLAFQDGKISLALYFITLLGAFLFHAGANTLNDYLDLKNKIDTPEAPTALYRPHPVFTNLLKPSQLLLFSAFLMSASLIIGIFLAIFLTALIGLMILSGIFLAFFYTGGPRGLKYMALGEPVVFLAFGPLMIEGAYAVQRTAVSVRAFYVSLPIGVLVALVLLANNLRDLDFDAKSGIHTICTTLGRAKALTLYLFLSITPFALICLYMLLRILSWQALLVFFTLPLAVRLNREFFIKIPVNSDAKTSQLTFLFGLCLILALMLGK